MPYSTVLQSTSVFAGCGIFSPTFRPHPRRELSKSGKEFQQININFSGGTYVESLLYGIEVSLNGYHVGILYDGMVYCNIHPYGLPILAWVDDFVGAGSKYVYYGPRRWTFED